MFTDRMTERQKETDYNIPLLIISLLTEADDFELGIPKFVIIQ